MLMWGLCAVMALLWSCCWSDEVSLSVLPGSGVFEGGFVVLKCDPPEVAANWSIYRNTSTDPKPRPLPRPCGDGWGRLLSNSCKIGLAVPWDSGLYWCQSPEGAVSHTVHVRVSKEPVLLDMPSLPVHVGDDVTLRCLNRDHAAVAALFYKDDQPLVTDPRDALPLRGVALSDRGSYRCSSGGNMSDPATLRVVNQSRPLTKDSASNCTDAEPGSAHLHLGLKLLCHLLVVCPYCISTALMVSLSRRRPQDKKQEVQRAVHEDAIAAVTTEHHF